MDLLTIVETVGFDFALIGRSRAGRPSWVGDDTQGWYIIAAIVFRTLLGRFARARPMSYAWRYCMRC